MAIKLWVEKRKYFHPDSDRWSWTYQVMQPHPNEGQHPYSIANYSSLEAAEYHARTGKKPEGYA